MSFLKALIGFTFSVILLNSCAQTETKMKNAKNVYDITINNIDGDAINLSDYKGKFILFVNVASKCGFTPQYKELQDLYETYKEDLIIIGSPCNQFGKQEPGNAEEIKSFCNKNYGVTFLITEKINVKGDNQHPLYVWLTSKEINGVKNSNVKWNFQKYLVRRNGGLIDYFYSITSPKSEKITKYFSK